MKVYFAADHSAFDLKGVLMEHVRQLSTAARPYDIEDCGAFSFDKADDYPDFVGRAGQLLAADAAQGIESRAIVLGASGQGEAMAMNRFRGVRCAVFYSNPRVTQTDMAGKELDLLSSTREHNNANALSLAARFLTLEEAKEAVAAWLSFAFSGDVRHARRIQKLDTLGQ